MLQTIQNDQKRFFRPCTTKTILTAVERDEQDESRKLKWYKVKNYQFAQTVTQVCRNLASLCYEIKVSLNLRGCHPEKFVPPLFSMKPPQTQYIAVETL